MTNTLLLVEIFVTLIMGIYFFSALKNQKNSKTVVKKESRKEVDRLKKMRETVLTEPLTEKSRPGSFEEIIGQQNGIKALEAAICSPNPQHVIIYGPPGTGKTAAARLVLEYAKKNKNCPFDENSKFIEIDATTIRCDERGIADPLIGSVHDPIYQGAGSLGLAGVPQPKPGAVTKAHGGILFIDEIGEMHPSEMNKLLKVLEDRKVFLDSAYYNSSDNNIPDYVRDIFDNGLPADFRLIGATTRSPEEIPPALRSRCVEVFFRALMPEEIKKIALNCVKKINYKIEDEASELVSKYCNNGREIVNLIQLAAGLALNDNRDTISSEDIGWILENGQYTPKIMKKIPSKPKVGYVNGLAVYGANMGMLMEIEVTALKSNFKKGTVSVTGVIEEEEIKTSNRKMIRKSTAWCSVKNVITVMKNTFGLECNEYDIHINFPGGVPVDGPSAGISITTAVYSAITDMEVDNKVAMTGEISIHGEVRPVGGVSAKVEAGIKAGAKKIIIPKENWQDKFKNIPNVKIIPVSYIQEVIDNAILNNKKTESSLNIDNSKVNVLSAESIQN